MGEQEKLAKGGTRIWSWVVLHILGNPGRDRKCILIIIFLHLLPNLCSKSDIKKRGNQFQVNTLVLQARILSLSTFALSGVTLLVHLEPQNVAVCINAYPMHLSNLDIDIYTGQPASHWELSCDILKYNPQTDKPALLRSSGRAKEQASVGLNIHTAYNSFLQHKSWCGWACCSEACAHDTGWFRKSNTMAARWHPHVTLLRGWGGVLSQQWTSWQVVCCNRASWVHMEAHSIVLTPNGHFLSHQILIFFKQMIYDSP